MSSQNPQITKSLHIYVYVSCLSLVLKQVLISFLNQQVSSTSPASTQAQLSQPVITDSTWEEYQQAQTLGETATFQVHYTIQQLQNTWRLQCVCVHATISSNDQIMALRT